MKSGFRAKRYVRSVHRATARIECSRIISSREIYGLFISTTGGTAGVNFTQDSALHPLNQSPDPIFS